MGGAWLVLFALSTCWFVTARYTLDYAMLMTAASIVLIESMADEHKGTTFRTRLRLLSVLLALYSIILGSLLGLTGPMNAFEKNNPRMFHRISRALG
jgi:hypothetical protein